jgi:hypothetical protein
VVRRSDDAPRMAFRPLAEIERMPEDERWLVEGLLSSGGLLVLAATPKSGKTWVSLAVGVSVASGKTLIGHFHVARPGRVMLFPAEDDVRSVRERIESLCAGVGIAFEDLPIDVITADRLQLDREDDRALLEQLLAERQPKLLVLDPLVRLHGGAESYVGHIAELFGYLRSLQRRFGTAILLTHHVAKNRSGGGRRGELQPGQAMRGSGDIHAAYDHGAMLHRDEHGVMWLALEHRTAPSPEVLGLRMLAERGRGVRFDVAGVEVPTSAAPPKRSLKSDSKFELSNVGGSGCFIASRMDYFRVGEVEGLGFAAATAGLADIPTVASGLEILYCCGMKEAIVWAKGTYVPSKKLYGYTVAGGEAGRYEARGYSGEGFDAYTQFMERSDYRDRLGRELDGRPVAVAPPAFDIMFSSVAPVDTQQWQRWG